MAGRPPKEVDMDEVKHLLAFDFHLDEIAATLDVSSSTLYRRLKVYGIEKYSDISDADLDYTIQSIKEEHPNDGEVLGGESVDVRRLMSEEHQSTSAVITGSSTHNERIERLWNDVRRSVSEEFRCLFYQLEQEGSLEPLNETDIYCLHYIFVPRINKVLTINYFTRDASISKKY